MTSPRKAPTPSLLLSSVHVRALHTGRYPPSFTFSFLTSDDVFSRVVFVVSVIVWEALVI